METKDEKIIEIYNKAIKLAGFDTNKIAEIFIGLCILETGEKLDKGLGSICYQLDNIDTRLVNL